MAAGKLHEGEAEIDVELVRRLIDSQFPQYAASTIEAFPSTGTVNAIYRLGEQLYARLPRVERWAGHLETELAWLPSLAPRLSLAVPEPVRRGYPEHGYPFGWAIFRWLAGETFEIERVGDERRAATELAQFVIELRAIDPTSAPASGRAPVPQLDAATRHAIATLPPEFDADAVTAAWERCLTAPSWDGRRPVWRHCDLLPPNLLVEDGRLKAVIDFGGAGIGDPAADVIAAWSVFGPLGRAAFRDVLDVDDATWERARGYALHQALLIIPYYAATNPGFVVTATRTVERVLADMDA